MIGALKPTAGRQFKQIKPRKRCQRYGRRKTASPWGPDWESWRKGIFNTPGSRKVYVCHLRQYFLLTLRYSGKNSWCNQRKVNKIITLDQTPCERYPDDGSLGQNLTISGQFSWPKNPTTLHGMSQPIWQHPSRFSIRRISMKVLFTASTFSLSSVKRLYNL